VVASLNGWPGIPTASSGLATGTVPGTARKVTTATVALPLFLAYLADWHKTVMPIDGSSAYLGPDGWEYRQARTGAGLSNHASGTAVDVRYDVLKADHARHMTAAQIVAVHNLLDKYTDASGRRVFGWGGDWTVGTYCDEMHTELAQAWAIGAQNRPTTAADVTVVIARLGIRPDGTVAAPVKPSAPPYPGKPIGWGSTGPAVKALQTVLAAMYPGFGVKVTGTYLPLRDGAFRRAAALYASTHPAALTADRVKPGAFGPTLYGSVMTRYPR
jgi:hypothetical protein